MPEDLSTIVLAAGLSRRMGPANKLLLPYGKSTVIGHVINELIESNIKNIIVVVGHEEDKVRSALKSFDLEYVYNKDYQSGMTSSIQAGVEASTNATGYLICLGDMPLLSSKEYQEILREINQSKGKRIIRPFRGALPGHPIYFSGHFRDEILGHQEKEGCRGVIKPNLEYLKKIEMKSAGILRDIDSQEDFNSLLKEFE